VLVRASTAAWARRGVVLSALVFGLSACGDYGTTSPGPGPTPTPTPVPTPTPAVPGVVPGPATGRSAIVLLAADPLPGSTIGGCAHASDCAGRLRMTFRVTPAGNGTVLFHVGFLHAPSKIACLQGRTAGGAVPAGEAQTVEIVFDQADPSDRCRTPLDLSDLAFNVEGSIEVAARQEWALAYHLVP